MSVLPHLSLSVWLCLLARIATSLVFQDVTSSAGLSSELSPPTLKYGGPVVADLDLDGYPDLLLGHHVDNMTIYFNNGNGTFYKHPFSIRADIHGISPFRQAPSAPHMNFILSIGGSNGLNKIEPRLFEVTNDRQITEIAPRGHGLSSVGGRGRTVIPLKIKEFNKPSIDMIVLNARNLQRTQEHRQHHFLVSSTITSDSLDNMNDFQVKADSSSTQFQVDDFNWWGVAVDINNDYESMEVLTFHDLQIYSSSSSSSTENQKVFNDITEHVLPRGLDVRGVSAITELDVDNDGWMDLYIARSTATHGNVFLAESGGYMEAPNDILLKNVNGKYIDISDYSGIPTGTQSKGVTSGDFNNDGWVDIAIVCEQAPHYILLNNKDSTFAVSEFMMTNYNPGAAIGDMITSVDYDLDGRLDFILSLGHYADRDLSATYRIIHNITPQETSASSSNNYLLVRVGSSPSGLSTSLHAVVIVNVVHPETNERLLHMKRRVGSPGTAVSNSYVEVVHFGLGESSVAHDVLIKWTDASTEAFINISGNQLITAGTIA